MTHLIALSQDNDGNGTGDDLDNWLNGGSAYGYVTKTYYDDAPFTVAPFGPDGQRNLRNRIATVTYEETDDGNDQTYDFASHYSYDVAGNVAVLVQEIPALHSLGQGFKKVEYDYDLISGNVNYVYYQRGEADQFTHYYQYNSANQLTDVHTSASDTEYPLGVWENDARYDYYKTGALGRLELGEERVQGLDYAYTLQGWIKGMNSSWLDPDMDMGEDGKIPSGPDHEDVARDAYAYTLSYFDGDYANVSGAGDDFVYDPPAGSAFDNAGPSLYNGNIRHMIMQQRFYKNIYGFGYNYDQLHRLVGQSNYIQKGSFFLQDRLATEYEYDENGNIELLRRQSDELFSNWMDDLDYSYQPGTNLLNSVTDDPQAEDGGFDGTSDYVYDGSGNLRQETKTIGADVTTHTIEWTPYGKVRSVSGPDNTTFAYDAQQNRLMKDFNGLKTYYIRDAQGNPDTPCTGQAYSPPTNKTAAPSPGKSSTFTARRVWACSRRSIQMVPAIRRRPRPTIPSAGNRCRWRATSCMR